MRNGIKEVREREHKHETKLKELNRIAYGREQNAETRFLCCKGSLKNTNGKTKKNSGIFFVCSRCESVSTNRTDQNFGASIETAKVH